MKKHDRTCKLLEEWGVWLRLGLGEMGWHREDVISRLMRYGGVISSGSVGNPVAIHVERLKHRTSRLIRCDNAIRSLARDQREAVIRYYALGQNQSEIAQHLGIGDSAVSRRINRARQFVGDFMESRPSEPYTRLTDAMMVSALRRSLDEAEGLTV